MSSSHQENKQIIMASNLESENISTSTTKKKNAILALSSLETSNIDSAAGKKMLTNNTAPGQGEQERHDRDHDPDPPNEVEQRFSPTRTPMEVMMSKKSREHHLHLENTCDVGPPPPRKIDLLFNNCSDDVLLAGAPTTPMTTIPPSSPTEQGQGQGQVPGQVRPFSSRRTTAGGSGGSFDSCTSGSSSLTSATAGVFVGNKKQEPASDRICSSAGENKNSSTRSSYDLLEEDQVVDNIGPVNVMTSEQPLSSSVSPPPGLEVVASKQGEEGNDVKLSVLSDNYISPEQLDYKTTTKSSSHQGLQLVRAKEVLGSSIVTLDLDDMLFNKKATTTGDHNEDVKSKKNTTDVEAGVLVAGSSSHQLMNTDHVVNKFTDDDDDLICETPQECISVEEDEANNAAIAELYKLDLEQMVADKLESTNKSASPGKLQRVPPTTSPAKNVNTKTNSSIPTGEDPDENDTENEHQTAKQQGSSQEILEDLEDDMNPNRPKTTRLTAAELKLVYSRRTTLYTKTKVCKFELFGVCRYGKDCNYAHSPDEIKRLPDFERTSFCKIFLKDGKCPNIPYCPYAHCVQDLRESPAPRQRLCVFFHGPNARCIYGRFCRYLHKVDNVFKQIYGIVTIPKTQAELEKLNEIISRHEKIRSPRDFMDLMETARNTPRHGTAVEEGPPQHSAITQLQVLALGKAKEAMNVAEMKGRLVPASGGGTTKGNNKNQNSLPMVDADGPDINYERVLADGKGETAAAAGGQLQGPGTNYSKGGHKNAVADEKIIMQQQFNMVKGGNGKAKGPGSSKKGGGAKGMMNNDQFLQLSLNLNSDSRGRSTSAQPTSNPKMLSKGSTAAAAPAGDQVDQAQVQNQEYLLSLSTSKEKQETLVSNISKDAQSFIAQSPEPGSLSPDQRMHRLRQLRAKQERARALLDDLLAANDYAARKRKVLRQQAASNTFKGESTSKSLGMKQAKHHGEGKDDIKVNKDNSSSTASCSTSTTASTNTVDKDKEEQEKLLEQEEKLAMQRIQGIFDVIADLDKEEKQFIEGSLKAKRDSGVVSTKSEESSSYPPAIIALGTNYGASSTGRVSSSSGLDSARTSQLSPLTLLAKTKQSSASCFEEREERSSTAGREEQLISNISGGDVVGVKKRSNELTLNLKGAGINYTGKYYTESEEDLHVAVCDESTTTRTSHPISEKKNNMVNKNKQGNKNSVNVEQVPSSAPFKNYKTSSANIKTDTSTFLTPAAYDYHHPCPLVLTRIGTSPGAGGQSIMMKEAAPSAKQGAAAGAVLPNNKRGAGEGAASNKGGRGIMYNDMAARRGATTASAPAQEDHSQQVRAGRNINIATSSATTAKTNKKTTTSTSRVVEQKNQTNKVVKNITHHDRKHSSTSTVRSSETTTPSVIEPPPGLEAQQPQMSVKNQLACVIGENNDERSPTWSMEIYMEGLHKKTPPRGAAGGHIRSKSYCGTNMINGFEQEQYNFNICPAPGATPTRGYKNLHAPLPFSGNKGCNSNYPATSTAAVSVYSPVNGSTPDSLGCTTASGKSNNSADNAENNLHSIKHVAGTKGYFAGKVENFYLHPGSSMLTPSPQKRSKSMHVEQLLAAAGGPSPRTPVAMLKGGGGAGGVSSPGGKTNGKIWAETNMKGSCGRPVSVSPTVSGNKNDSSCAGKGKNPSGQQQQAAAQDNNNKPTTAKGGKGTSKGSKNPRSKSYHFGDQVRMLAMAHYGVGWNGKDEQQCYYTPAGVENEDTTALHQRVMKEVGKGGKMNRNEQQGATATGTARDGKITTVDKIFTHENHYKIFDEDHADNEIIEWPCTSNSEEEAGATWSGYKKSRRERLENNVPEQPRGNFASPRQHEKMKHRVPTPPRPSRKKKMPQDNYNNAPPIFAAKQGSIDKFSGFPAAAGSKGGPQRTAGGSNKKGILMKGSPLPIGAVSCHGGNKGGYSSTEDHHDPQYYNRYDYTSGQYYHDADLYKQQIHPLFPPYKYNPEVQQLDQHQRRMYTTTSGPMPAIIIPSPPTAPTTITSGGAYQEPSQHQRPAAFRHELAAQDLDHLMYNNSVRPYAVHGGTNPNGSSVLQKSTQKNSKKLYTCAAHVDGNVPAYFSEKKLHQQRASAAGAATAPTAPTTAAYDHEEQIAWERQMLRQRSMDLEEKLKKRLHELYPDEQVETADVFGGNIKSGTACGNNNNESYYTLASKKDFSQHTATSAHNYGGFDNKQYNYSRSATGISSGSCGKTSTMGTTPNTKTNISKNNKAKNNIHPNGGVGTMEDTGEPIGNVHKKYRKKEQKKNRVRCNKQGTSGCSSSSSGSFSTTMPSSNENFSNSGIIQMASINRGSSSSTCG